MKDSDYKELVEKIRKYTKGQVKKSRFEHSIRVADMCVALCKRYNLDEKKGYIVGIGHDMCKDLPHDQMIELAKKDGNSISEFELNRPSLLHGRAAAVMMKEKFGITDADMLDAVANHVSGRVKISDLGKILFLADKTEPGRPQSTDEYRERLIKMALNEHFYTVIVENYEYVKGKGFEIYPDTEKMIEYYKECITAEGGEDR